MQPDPLAIAVHSCNSVHGELAPQESRARVLGVWQQHYLPQPPRQHQDLPGILCCLLTKMPEGVVYMCE